MPHIPITWPHIEIACEVTGGMACANLSKNEPTSLLTRAASKKFTIGCRAAASGKAAAVLMVLALRILAAAGRFWQLRLGILFSKEQTYLLCCGSDWSTRGVDRLCDLQCVQAHISSKLHVPGAMLGAVGTGALSAWLLFPAVTALAREGLRRTGTGKGVPLCPVSIARSSHVWLPPNASDSEAVGLPCFVTVWAGALALGEINPWTELSLPLLVWEVGVPNFCLQSLNLIGTRINDRSIVQAPHNTFQASSFTLQSVSGRVGSR